MFKRILCALLSLCLVLTASLALAQQEKEKAPTWLPARLSDVLMTKLDEKPDAEKEENQSENGDTVSITADGSVTVTAGDMTLHSRQPVGWTILTRSASAQPEIHADGTGQIILEMMEKMDAHLAFFNGYYLVVSMVILDESDELPAGMNEEDADVKLAAYYEEDAEGIETRTIGAYRYVVMPEHTLEGMSYQMYVTMVDGTAVCVLNLYLDKHGEEETAITEDALAQLRVSRSGAAPQINAVAAPKRELTVMVYMTGTDLESGLVGGAYASNSLNAMKISGYDREKINVVVFTGGTRRWHSPIPSDHNTIQLIGENNEMTEVYRTEKLMSMGQSETLSFFLNYCVAAYPAERYALIFFDHGGGPVDGLCFDELYGDDSIDLAELQTAFEASPFGGDTRLEFIYFVTCLTASVEYASVCAPYADWMIASEEPALGRAMPYSFLKGAETKTGLAVGIEIADTFYETAMNMLPEDRHTMAVFDLRRMDALNDAMTVLFTAMESKLTPETYPVFAKSALNAKRVDPSDVSRYDRDLVDLRSLIESYRTLFPEEAAAVLAAMDEVVVYSVSSEPEETGMSVYHPNYNNSAYDMRVYSRMPIPEAYGRYVGRYGEIRNTRASAGTAPASEPARTEAQAETQNVTLSMDPQRTEVVYTAELLILEDTGTAGTFRLIGRIDVPVGEEGTIDAMTSNEALYVLDENGQPITDALEYSVVDGEIILRGVLEVDLSYRALDLEDVNALDLDEDTDSTVNVRIRCKRRDDGSLTIVRVEPLTGSRAPNGSNVEFSDYDTLYLVSMPRQIAYAEDGTTLLPWSEWQDGGIHSYRYAVNLGREWSLGFVDDHLNWVGRWGMLVTTDVYGDSAVEAWFPLENSAVEEIAVEPAVLYEDESSRIELAGCWRVSGSGTPALFLRWKLTNLTGEPVVFTGSEYMLNGETLDKPDELLGTLQPGQSAYATTRIIAPAAEETFPAGTEISLTFGSLVETGFGLWAPVTVALP